LHAYSSGDGRRSSSGAQLCSGAKRKTRSAAKESARGSWITESIIDEWKNGQTNKARGFGGREIRKRNLPAAKALLATYASSSPRGAPPGLAISARPGKEQAMSEENSIQQLERIANEADMIQATVSQNPANMQEAIQNLACSIAELARVIVDQERKNATAQQ
jgi:hypothetical protein